jgi:hypothetical protein
MARDIEDDIEDGVVAYGRIKAIGGGIVGIIIAISFCCVGFFMIKSTNKKYNNIIGRMNQVTCNFNQQCIVDVEYIVENVPYKKSITLNRNKFPSEGKLIDLYYDPADPNQILTQSPTSSKLLGGGFMSVACLVIIGISVHLYLVMKYDQAAVESAYSTSSRSGRRGLIVIN